MKGISLLPKITDYLYVMMKQRGEIFFDETALNMHFIIFSYEKGKCFCIDTKEKMYVGRIVDSEQLKWFMRSFAFAKIFEEKMQEGLKK